MKSSKQELAIQQIIREAHGKWADILSLLNPDLSNAINNQPQHVSCPVHGGTDGLRAFHDFDQTGGMICNTCGAFPNGILVVKWMNGWSTKKSIQAIRRALRNPTLLTASCPELNASKEILKPLDDYALRMFHEMCDQVIPITDPEARPARKYLKNRGLRLEQYPDSLTYHPNLIYYDVNGGHSCYYPALIADVERNSELITFHRTYITIDGFKADVPSPKKLLPSYRKGETVGAAIPLFNPDNHLAVAEGIETALAVYESTGVPVWATITAGGMKSLEVHKHIKRVDIYADLDLSGTGEKAAYALKQRLLKEGKSVNIYLPGGPIPAGQKSKDWLDVLLEEDAA